MSTWQGAAEWILRATIAGLAYTYIVYPVALFVLYTISQTRRDLKFSLGEQDRRVTRSGEEIGGGLEFLQVEAGQRERGAALNAAAHAATADVLVGCPAGSVAEPAKAALARHFEDSSVGMVCGYPAAKTWRTPDSIMRLMEGRLGMTSGGAVYAVRRRCFPILAADAAWEDLALALKVRQAGYRVIHDPEAECVWTRETGEARVERTADAWRALPVMWRTPMRATARLCFLSHEILPSLLPFWMAASTISCTMLVEHPDYRTVAAAEAVFYALAAAGWCLKRIARAPKILLLPYRIVAAAIQYAKGSGCALRGRVAAQGVRAARAGAL